jgi:predicted transcriptional regulator
VADYRYTPDEVIAALKETKGLHALAATKLGCSERTVRNYIERFPDVAEAVKHQKEGMLDVAEGKLYSAINKGEAWAICFFLKTQGKARKYSERLEVTGQDGGPIKQEQTIFKADKVPDAELEAAVKEVERLLLS